MEAQTVPELRGRFFPRSVLPQRMVGGIFQGSNNASSWTNLATITSQPSTTAYTEISLGTAPYRYLRYLSPANNFGNVAELEFYRGGARLTGPSFGSPGSYNNDPSVTFHKALDGNIHTYFDAPDSNTSFVGIDTGDATLKARFFPRSNLPGRMVGGTFQGSNDASSWANLGTITATPSATAYSELPLGLVSYRYLRYLAPGGSYANIAELEFYRGPVRLTGSGFGSPGSYNNDPSVTFDKALDGKINTYFDQVDTGNGYFVGIDTGTPAGASTGSWQAGMPISCGGIRWPGTGNTIGRGGEGHLSSFLALDFDQFDVTAGGQLISSQVRSDTCSYTWSASFADGTPAGSFKNGINRGQGVVWIAPNTPGTVTLRLVVDDQNAFNFGNGEGGNRNDASRGYNDAPQTFSTSVSVGP